MKKRRKRSAVSRRAASSVRQGRSSRQVPQSFIDELSGLMRSGRFELAARKAEAAIERWPQDPLAWKAHAGVLFSQGKLREAINSLTKCLELAPEDLQSINNLGAAHLELNHLDQAEKNFLKALESNPDYAQAHNNLGITLMKQGRIEEAVARYRHALRLMPDFTLAHNNLGNALREAGNYEEALQCFQKALQLNQDFAEAHYNLGNVLSHEGRLGEAESSFRQALALNDSYALAHSGIGEILLKRGQADVAITHYRKCIDLDPLLIQGHDGLSKALGARVPLWHVPMMNDGVRNDAYFAALKNVITPETHVLEIGTGSGLLAMMAAKLGAKKVTTCEVVPEIAEVAERIIADNGYGSKIKVVPKISTSMTVGEDLDEQADLLISEVLSSEFLGEGVLFSIGDAKRRLLKQGGSIIPARGSIQFALVGGDDIEKNVRVEEVYGFDLSRFNDIVSRKQFLTRQDLGLELLSDDTCALSFDFEKNDRFSPGEQIDLEVPVRRRGRCLGIIQWIRLEMDDSIVFENHPSVINPASGWNYFIYVFPEVIEVEQDQVVRLSVVHNRNTPWFFYRGLE